MTSTDYPPRAAWRALAVLTLAYLFSFVDRQVLNLLVDPIRADLRISDTEMSLLMGASFAIFYTLFGIPLGRLADSGDRIALIAWGMTLWCAATIACGFAETYWQLLLGRVAVGIGEAALSPAAYSLLTDAFPKERRATALSVYSAGIYLGAGLAFVFGGLAMGLAALLAPLQIPVIHSLRPWQIVLVFVGLAGLVCVPLLRTVREPERKFAGAAPLREVLAHLRKHRAAVLCHHLGIAAIALSGYALTAWAPTLFVRRSDWQPATAGVMFGAVFGPFGMLGILFGGRYADWLAARGRRDANLYVAKLGAAACAHAGILYPLLPDPIWTLVALAPLCFFVAVPFGVATAAIQETMPPRMRAQASALYLFVVNLIGLGLGPTAVALLTDHVFHDDKSVHLSLLIVVVAGALASTTLLALGRKPYLRMLDALVARAA